MLLGGGGLEIGLFDDPGPGVAAPGAHGPFDGAPATVVEVPGGCDGVLPATVLDPVELPVGELLLMEGVVAVVPLLVGVQGEATVVVVLDWFVPKVPPVTLPALPAVPGVPCVAAGVPVELAPGGIVEVGFCVLVVPGVVLVTPGCVLVVPGCAVVVVGVVCPIPGLGVTVPVFCAEAMPTASANTDDANKIFRIEACSLSEIAAATPSRAGRDKDFILPSNLFLYDAPGRMKDGASRVAGSHFCLCACVILSAMDCWHCCLT